MYFLTRREVSRKANLAREWKVAVTLRVTCAHHAERDGYFPALAPLCCDSTQELRSFPHALRASLSARFPPSPRPMLAWQQIYDPAHNLFLSATPHNGHSNSFSALLDILTLSGSAAASR